MSPGVNVGRHEQELGGIISTLTIGGGFTGSQFPFYENGQNLCFGNGLPFCAMHMRVSSVSLPYLQNRLPSLIISAILAQYSSLCDHLVIQFNLG